MITVAVCLTAGRHIIGPKVLPAFPTPPATVLNDIESDRDKTHKEYKRTPNQPK